MPKREPNRELKRELKQDLRWKSFKGSLRRNKIASDHLFFFYIFRPAEGYCCIEYTATTWSVYGGSLGAAAIAGPDCGDPGATNQDSCADAVNCNYNFIIVPGVLSPQTCVADGSACYGNENGRDR